jgi:hypothetical protein
MQHPEQLRAAGIRAHAAAEREPTSAAMQMPAPGPSLRVPVVVA